MSNVITFCWIYFAILFVVALTGCAEKNQPLPITKTVNGGVQSESPSTNSTHTVTEKPTIRFATFNVALNRKTAGALAEELASGQSKSATQLAEIIQRVRPAVLLLNEFDYDAVGQGIESFQSNFLA